MVLERISYAELCRPAEVGELASGDGHLIAALERPEQVTPAVPDDLAGAMDLYSADRPEWKALPESWWGLGFETPPIYAAALDQVTCFGGRIAGRRGGFHDGGNLLVVEDHWLVPDSWFVRDGSATLPRELVARAEDGTWELSYTAGDARRLGGTHLLLGGAHGQFGHFILEGLSRLWALELPGVAPETVVVYQPDLFPWQVGLIEGLGIERDRVLCLTEPATFERLIVPSIACHLHRSISPRMNAAWAPIGDRYADGREDERFYVSRSRFTKRRELEDEVLVEELFRERGFTVVHPERMPVAEQVAMARSAEVLAGSAGSGMYLGAFQRRGALKVIVTPRSFTLVDDLLISHVRGGRLAYFISDDLAPSEERGPRNRDYRVDRNELAAAVDRLLA